MTVAILCSGQECKIRIVCPDRRCAGSLSLFKHAAKLLGRDPRDFVRRETSEALHRNRAGQILCTLQALAAAAVLRETMPDRIVVAGYSVGEVAAWGIAGLLGMTDTLDLVARRAEAMDAASLPGDGLLYVRGLCRADIDRLCERYEAAVAIVNPCDAFVLGGGQAALIAIAEQAKIMNAAKVIRLPVEVASHTRRLVAASAKFRKACISHPRHSRQQRASGS